MVLDAALIIVAASLAVPAVVFFLECTLGAFGTRRRVDLPAGARPSVAIVVPAHDEEPVIQGTVASLLPQLGPADRLVVVADNCSDRTAAVARAAGAEAIERRDPDRRGKGHALEFGVRSLATAPPEVVVVVDADCTLHPGSLGRLASLAVASGQPVQARNVVLAAAGAGALERVSAFAFVVKNVARPSGLARAGLPCPLMGTGMAFPWPVICAAPSVGGALAEDLQLGADLSLAGHPARFCPDALVTSPLARQHQDRRSQRTRWEHGHLATLLSRGPQLLGAAIARRSPSLLAQGLDLCIPPLSLLVLVVTAALAAALVAAFLGASWLPAMILAGAESLVVIATALAWFAFGREQIAFATLLCAPFYVLAKIPIYVGFIVRRQRDWVRTERDPADHGPKR